MNKSQKSFSIAGLGPFRLPQVPPSLIGQITRLTYLPGVKTVKARLKVGQLGKQSKENLDSRK